jgi:hypothetical protein
MPKILTPAQVAQYERDGFTSAVNALDPDEVARCRAELEAWEARMGKALDFPEKSKSYLLFDWADRIVHHPRVLDAVEDLIGSDILVYHATMWIKEPHSPAHVLWHQDGAYFFLEPALHVTAWVALSDATVEAGCMHFLPGTHRLSWLAHEDRPGPHNMIRRGQGLPQYEGARGVPVPVLAGQLSLHHTRTVHSSGANRTGDRRMGFGISYIPTSVRPVGPVRPSALLVRGVDRHGHFVAEERLRPGMEMSPAARAAHARANGLFRALQDAGFATT